MKSKLEAADEKKLLAELGKLIERLGITDRYTITAVSPISAEMVEHLPPVLANIVVDYTWLSCFDPDDVDGFRRILLMPKE